MVKMTYLFPFAPPEQGHALTPLISEGFFKGCGVDSIRIGLLHDGESGNLFVMGRGWFGVDDDVDHLGHLGLDLRDDLMGQFMGLIQRQLGVEVDVEIHINGGGMAAGADVMTVADAGDGLGQGCHPDRIEWGAIQ